MTSGECFENKWFYMKYIGKYLSVEILLTRVCTYLFETISENVVRWKLFFYGQMFVLLL